jgi:hypothetical protein
VTEARPRQSHATECVNGSRVISRGAWRNSNLEFFPFRTKRTIRFSGVFTLSGSHIKAAGSYFAFSICRSKATHR